MKRESLLKLPRRNCKVTTIDLVARLSQFGHFVSTLLSLSQFSSHGPIEHMIFHAGTIMEGGKLKTAGGRVLAVTGVSDTFEDALACAYVGVDIVSFEGKYFRKDIGHR